MATKRLMITGASGFVGQHLLALEQAGQLCGWTLQVPAAPFDVRQRAHWDQALDALQPDAVLHLAAQSHVPTAFSEPAATLEVNVLGTAHGLEALRARRFRGRFLFVSSADVYGLVSPEELPISEDRIPAPRNPYAVSKLSAEWLCRQFELTEGLNICIARPFNHTGAGQTTAFALPHFASQVAEIYWRKKPPVIEVGDIDVTRDFCTVGDVLQAYLAILEDGKRGEIYNVCSERELRLRDALDWMMRAAGVRAEVRQDVARLRMAEQRRVQGSAAKLRRHTGWTPRDSADKLLHDLLLDWMLRKSR